MLVNLQPVARPMQVEVRLGSERRTIGTAQDSVDKRADMRAALVRVDEAVAAGLFALRDRATWRFQMGHSSEDDWRYFMDKPTRGEVEVDLRQLEEALARPDGCVMVTEDNLASVYERLETAPARPREP